jgi:hypothetical protein
MIKFKKVKESIEDFETFYLKICDLKANRDFSKYSDNETIDAVIKSKFHYWRGEEEPNGQTISLSFDNKSKTLINYKLYGFFDNDKLSSLNYISIAFEDFKKKFLVSICEFSEGDYTYERKAEKIINDSFNPTAMYYYLDLSIDDDKFIAEWTPYWVFNASISIDKENNIATLIELGDD